MKHPILTLKKRQDRYKSGGLGDAPNDDGPLATPSKPSSIG